MISPPRAEGKALIPPESLDLPTFKGWWGQLKMNGQYLIVEVHKGKHLSATDREWGPPKNFKWTEASAAIWKKLPPGQYVAEYLNAKVKDGPKDTWYAHDLLKLEGVSMLGNTYATRNRLLKLQLYEDLGIEETEHEGYWAYRPNLWFPWRYDGYFYATFKEVIKVPWVEGLILKNPNAPLTMDNKQGWSVKSRKPHGNYSH